MLSAAKHLALKHTHPLSRGTRFLAVLGMTRAYGVEYGDRTVSMSEAARRAVEKLGRN